MEYYRAGRGGCQGIKWQSSVHVELPDWGTQTVAKHLARCPKCGNELTYESAGGDHIQCASCGAVLRAPGSSKPTDPLIGQTMGQYTITGLLGRGGMGAVYKGHQASLGRDVAIKILPKQLAEDAKYVERFRREARSAAAISHPNIIEVFDIGEDQGHQYIAMELVDGETLSQRLRRDGRLSPGDALDVLKQVALALEAAHEKGIFHRDIKPGNILFTSRGLVKVADFGLAKQQGVDVSVTATGASLGTPLYMPPEVSRGQAADARSDLYSLGATFYQALAGKAPFEGNSPTEVVLKHIEKPVPPLQNLAPNTPPALGRAIHKLLRKNPAERYQGAAELLAALGKVGAAPLADGPSPVRSERETRPHNPRPSRESKPQGKSRLPLLLGGIGAAVTLVLVLVFAFGGKNGERPQAKAPPEKVATPVTPNKAPTPPPVKKRPATAPKKTPPTPTPSRDPEEQEATDTFVRAQRAAKNGTWLSASNSLAKLDKDYTKTEYYAEHRAAIEALNAKVRAALKKPEPPKPPDKPGPRPAPKAAEPKPTEPKPAPAEPKPDPKVAVTLGAIDARLAAWDFAGATEVLAVSELPAGTLTEKKDEVARLAKLKAQIIAKINAAKPPWKKSHLLLTGMNGDITKADDTGITIKLMGDKTETIAWKDMKNRSVGMLLNRCLDRKEPAEWIAAGLLSLALGDPSRAEGHFRQAKTLGGTVAPYLAPLAEASFKTAAALLEKGDFEKAKAALAAFDTKYGATPWAVANKQAIDAAGARAEGGIIDAAAETLYAQAAKLYVKKDFWALKPVIEKLKADFPNAPLLLDAARNPAVADMVTAVGALGKLITVRKDGKGDFKTIQAALDSAPPPNSVVEVTDGGVYAETVGFPAKSLGLTLRGKKGTWPVITSEHPRMKPLKVLVTVRGGRPLLEQFIVSHTKVTGGWHSYAVLCEGSTDARLRRLVLYAGDRHCFHSKSEGTTLEASILCKGMGDSYGSNVVVRDALILHNGGGGAYNKGCAYENVLMANAAGIRGRQPIQFRSCTILGAINLAGDGAVVRDCYARKLNGGKTHTVEHTNVWGGNPLFGGDVKPGKGCMSAKPHFRNPEVFDYRLKPKSPGTGKASDGGDIGVRYTPEMIEVLQKALELREKGIIKF